MDNFTWFFNKIRCNELVSVDDLISYFISENIISQSYCCSACNSPVKLRKDKFKADGLFYICISCKKKFSFKKIVFNDKIKIQLTDFFKIIICFLQEIKTDIAEKSLGINKKTIIKYYTVIRRSIKKYMDTFSERLGEYGEVEIDPTLISKRKYNRRRLTEQKWLWGAIERNTGNFYIKSVENRTLPVLRNVIRDTIKEDSFVLSDEWPSYMHFFGGNDSYYHESVNHNREFVNAITSAHTQNIENLWSRLKRTLRARYLSNRSNLELYLAEFCFRCKNKEKNIEELFIQVLMLIKNLDN